ncbi:MAG: ATP-binding protein, partial [Halobacteria archaeon]|nr:ATP-binding protein [Halobacteria archaeon]
MSQSQRNRKTRLSASNIGGINELETEFYPGVNILGGPNASNKTSTLHAIMAALGSNDVSLQSGKTEGSAELTIDGETYTRKLERKNGDVVSSGDPFLTDDQEVKKADLFAFLLEDNIARRAIESDTNLREVLMCPVDIDEIERELRQLREEREETKQKIQEVEELESRIPELREEKQNVNDEINELREELEALEKEFEELDKPDGSPREEEIEEKRRELEDTEEKIRNNERLKE